MFEYIRFYRFLSQRKHSLLQSNLTVSWAIVRCFELTCALAGLSARAGGLLDVVPDAGGLRGEVVGVRDGGDADARPRPGHLSSLAAPEQDSNQQ